MIWGGEFGRTPMLPGEAAARTVRPRPSPAALHHWLAGGGDQAGGHQLRRDRRFGYNIAQDPVHVHDLHATLLHLMGIDHERLTYKFQGRQYRLTDVGGKVVRPVLA